VIRDLAAKILAGSTLGSLAADLDARGVPTALGGKWTGPNVSVLLRRPHLVGRRVHLGKTYEADWPAILDVSTWERRNWF
jgi:hypothetical protein